jgi:hypothetical protein
VPHAGNRRPHGARCARLPTCSVPCLVARSALTLAGIANRSPSVGGAAWRGSSKDCCLASGRRTRSRLRWRPFVLRALAALRRTALPSARRLRAVRVDPLVALRVRSLNPAN